MRQAALRLSVMPQMSRGLNSYVKRLRAVVLAPRRGHDVRLLRVGLDALVLQVEHVLAGLARWLVSLVVWGCGSETYVGDLFWSEGGLEFEEDDVDDRHGAPIWRIYNLK